MNTPVKYSLFVVGFLLACIGVFNMHVAAAIVSAGAFIAYAILEATEFKSKI